ncbi:MAG: hypothetical protein FD129_1355 [bacterium]|nr:MAG: hypothetical protein FD129_1355 [bacterium]
MNHPRSAPVAGTALLLVTLLVLPGLPGCAQSNTATRKPHDLEERSFRWFWDVTDSTTGLTPDRWPTRSFQSIAATGFALTACPIGVERGWIKRDEASRRVLATLRFLWRFDRQTPVETEIRALTDSLYARVDWEWVSIRPPLVGHGWKPESGHMGYDWRGYNEAMLVYLFALGSPTHPVPRAAWDGWISGYQWGTFQGQEHLGFCPLFGHQYTHAWIDFRGIHDAYMRERGIDYFENSRRATLAQQAYAVANPGGFTAYGDTFWGLTACDGPVNGTFPVKGRPVQFNTYWARGAGPDDIRDDGTVSPAAAGGSIAFAPEIVIPTLMAMREAYGENLYSTYGFLDALNPTFRFDTAVQHGRIVPGVGWFDTDYLGIDQGPILLMTENHRSELVWKAMRNNPHVRRGLKAAGFTGGWLGAEPDGR